LDCCQPKFLPQLTKEPLNNVTSATENAKLSVAPTQNTGVKQSVRLHKTRLGIKIVSRLADDFRKILRPT